MYTMSKSVDIYTRPDDVNENGVQWYYYKQNYLEINKYLLILFFSRWI